MRFTLFPPSGSLSSLGGFAHSGPMVGLSGAERVERGWARLNKPLSALKLYLIYIFIRGSNSRLRADEVYLLNWP